MGKGDFESIDEPVNKPKPTPRPPKPKDTHPKEPGDVRRK